MTQKQHTTNDFEELRDRQGRVFGLLMSDNKVREFVSEGGDQGSAGAEGR